MKSQILLSALFLIVVQAALADGQKCDLSDIISTLEKVDEGSNVISEAPKTRDPFSVTVTNACKRCDAEGVSLEMKNDAGIPETVLMKPIAAGQSVLIIYRAVGTLAHIKTLTANFVNCS